jgi:hypothetical protein
LGEIFVKLVSVAIQILQSNYQRICIMTTAINPKLLRSIQNSALQRLPARRRATTNLYLLEEVKPARSEVMARHQRIPIEQATIVVFVDDEPIANWSHDCRYLLHNAENGKLYREVKAEFPPYLVNPPKTFRAFHTPVALQNPQQKFWPLEEEVTFPWRLPMGTRYAILFSGASNNRHTNDLEFLYRQLVNRFYFYKDNITVLNYDGTINYSGAAHPIAPWPGDGTAYTMPVNSAGTKKGLEDALDALKPKLKPNDLLLIHTNNHGGHNGTESYLCTYSGSDYTASDFGKKLAELPNFADLIVMMEQCHSGGFNDVVIEKSTAQRTTFAAACTEGKNSIGGWDFDPFARDWTAALAGSDPYGTALMSNPDYDNSGKISTREAFAYADDVHNPYDSPVYSSFGADSGDQNLHQKWLIIHMYRPFVLKELRSLRDILPDPIEYRELMRTKVLPALTALDDKWAVRQPQQAEAQKMIAEVIHSAATERIARDGRMERIGH